MEVLLSTPLHASSNFTVSVQLANKRGLKKILTENQSQSVNKEIQSQTYQKNDSVNHVECDELTVIIIIIIIILCFRRCVHLLPFICVSSWQCSVWVLEVLNVTPVQHLCQYVNELALDYAIAETVSFQLPCRVAQVR
jgi:uncharacterized membrane protein